MCGAMQTLQPNQQSDEARRTVVAAMQQLVGQVRACLRTVGFGGLTGCAVAWDGFSCLVFQLNLVVQSPLKQLGAAVVLSVGSCYSRDL